MDMKVVGLFGVAVLITALLVQVGPSTPTDEPRLVFPGLNDHLSQVTKVEIAHPDGRVIVLLKEQGAWTLPGKAGYRADFKKLSGFLVGLSELLIAEEKTALPQNHARLGLATDGLATDGVIVSIQPGDYSLVVGNTATSRGTFVRYPGDDQVYLTNEPVKVPADTMDWIDPVVINVDADNVREVALSTSAAKILSGARSEVSGEFEISGVPDDRELSYESVADSLARLLVNVRMTGLERFEPQVFDNATIARFSLMSGEKVVVRTVDRQGRYWMHIDRENLADWQFEIIDFTFKSFNKTMDDMLKPEENLDSTDAGDE